MSENKFVEHSEEIAGGITGENSKGEQMLLGNDVLIYFKYVVVEQPVLNRLRETKCGTLFDEIDRCKGKVILGEIQAVQEKLHEDIDKMFAAIIKHRETKKVAEQQ